MAITLLSATKTRLKEAWRFPERKHKCTHEPLPNLFCQYPIIIVLTEGAFDWWENGCVAWDKCKLRESHAECARVGSPGFIVKLVIVTSLIDLSVSPSPWTQTSQWQSSISCTGSGTRTSLGFSAKEKHWKIRSSHRFYGVYASKMEKLCAWGTCNTDSRYPERMGNIVYFITFPESKQNRAKCP